MGFLNFSHARCPPLTQEPSVEVGVLEARGAERLQEPVDLGGVLARHFRKHDELLDPNPQPHVLQNGRLALVKPLPVVRAEDLERHESLRDLVDLREVGHLERRIKRVREAHVRHHIVPACRRKHEKALALGRLLLEEDHESLEHRVREPRPNRGVLEEALDVVDNNHAQGRLVRVVKDLCDRRALGRFRVADHLLRRDDLDKRKLRVHREARGKGRLATARRTLEEDRDERRAIAVGDLLHKQLAVVQHALDFGAPTDDAVPNAGAERLVRRAKGGLHLLERIQKVLAGHLEVLAGVLVHLDLLRRLDEPVHRKRRRAAHDTGELGAAVVLRERRELEKVHVIGEAVARLDLRRVDLEDLHAPVLVGKRNLHLDLQTTRPGERLVDHVLPVRHANHEHVVQLVHAVHLGEKLVDDRVVHARVVVARPALLANGINLVENDNVERRVLALRLELLLGVRKELANVLFRLADVLAENFRPVDNLRRARVEHLSDLPRHERLAGARRAIEQDALDVRDAELLEELRGEHTRRKRAAENVAELRVEATDAHLLKVPVRVDNGRARLRLVLSLEAQLRVRGLDKAHNRFVEENAKLPFGDALGGTAGVGADGIEVDELKLHNAHAVNDVLVLERHPLILL
eukprot:Opistho-1_new@27482